MNRYSKPIAIHEAGHAIGLLAMGVPVERIDVYKMHGQKHDGEISIAGRVRTPDGRFTSIRQEVTGLYAGPVAEARYRRWSLAACLLGSSAPGGDLASIEALLQELSEQ